MYLQATLTIDPAQLTEIGRTKPTKGFARIAHLLTGGLASATEERETFGAITILQQINVVLRSLGIDNIVRLAKDDTVFYEDKEGRTGDLKYALDAFAARAQPGNARLFNSLNLIVEHHTNDLACLIDIRILRTHPIGEHPIKITVNGLAAELDAKQCSDERLRSKMSDVFKSQASYDGFVNDHRASFETLLERLEFAITTQMRVDRVKVRSAVKIVRPNGRIKQRNDVPHSGYVDDGDYDPVYGGYHGYDGAFFYAWLWADSCHSNEIHCSNCTIVDSMGTSIREIDDAGFQAGDDDVLDVDTVLVLPESGVHSLQDDQASTENVSEFSTDISNDGKLGASGGGWLSSVVESIGGDGGWGESPSGGSSDGGSCGGSSCGGGCGGE